MQRIILAPLFAGLGEKLYKSRKQKMIWMIGKKINKKSRLNKINKEFTQQIGRIAEQIAKGKRNEEETRRWCVDLLRSAMGYKDADIETELSVLGQRVDIALKNSDKVFMVIECKAATVKLGDAAINQAATYAVALGAEWAVVTNGNTWMLFHVMPSKGGEPDLWLVFDVEILDDDGLSKEDVEYLNLLTKEAVLSGDTKQTFHNGNCLSFDAIRSAICSGPILSEIVRKIESEYKTKTGANVSITEDQLSEVLSWMIDISEEA